MEERKREERRRKGRQEEKPINQRSPPAGRLIPEPKKKIAECGRRVTERREKKNKKRRERLTRLLR